MKIDVRRNADMILECHCLDSDNCRCRLYVEVSDTIKLSMSDGCEAVNIILSPEQAIQLSNVLIRKEVKK